MWAAVDQATRADDRVGEAVRRECSPQLSWSENGPISCLTALDNSPRQRHSDDWGGTTALRLAILDLNHDVHRIAALAAPSLDQMC